VSLLDAIAADSDARRSALVSGERSLDYGTLLGLIQQLSAQLSAAGVATGECVLVLLPNGIEHVVAVLAAGAAGATAVPCDPAVGAERLARVMQETSPRLCVIAPGASAPAGVRALQLEIDTAGYRVQFSGEISREREAGAHATPGAIVRFTSGSTGRPKGVVLEADQQLWTARLLCDAFGFADDHRELLVAPVFHSGGWQRVAATLVAGGCVVIAQQPVSLPALLDDVATLGITGFFATPPLIRMLLASGDKAALPLARCRTLEIGSARLRGHELEQLLRLVPASQIFIHYGLTECSRALILDARSHMDKLDSVGRPAPGVDLQIRPEPGCQDDGSGQVLLRGPQLARSYWKRPDLDAECFVDGWLATRDYGRVDADGFLTLQGRRDDRINSGGHSFYPAEVEAELGPVAGVAQYLIAGVPDPRGILGEVPWAFVIPVDPADFSPREFSAAARRKLQTYMVPRKVLVVDSLPLTALGKPDRRAAALAVARAQVD
jgi:acyl-CoA synthetase (AMP-forming)/AMP-acid ligase II